jgi:hypothetical protein
MKPIILTLTAAFVIALAYHGGRRGTSHVDRSEAITRKVTATPTPARNWVAERLRDYRSPLSRNTNE